MSHLEFKDLDYSSVNAFCFTIPTLFISNLCDFAVWFSNLTKNQMLKHIRFMTLYFDNACPLNSNGISVKHAPNKHL